MKSFPRKSPRLYLDTQLTAAKVSLTENQAHYLRRVLRLKPGDPVVAFNGSGKEYSAIVDTLSRDRAVLSLESELQPLPESSLKIVLVQSLVKNDAMDTIIQKATELGVHRLIPVATEFSVIKLDQDRAIRRVAHWEKITASSCEQSGRHRPLLIDEPQSLEAGLARIPSDHLKLVLQPSGSEQPPRFNLPANPPDGVAALVGPEGGFSERDLQIINRAEFANISLGPRILRAETAAIAACALLQREWGDMSG